jgi:hypothetical protein
MGWIWDFSARFPISPLSRIVLPGLLSLLSSSAIRNAAHLLTA